MKKKNKGILTLAIIFFIILFSNIIFSNSNSFETGRACSNIFGNCDDALTTINDTCKDDCSGNACPTFGYARLKNVYINASSVLFGGGINTTCEFKETGSASNNYEYAWYYNGTEWLQVANWSNPTSYNSTGINKSVAFSVNSSEGTHIVRCIYSFGSSIDGSCANSTPCDDYVYDNDDVNFTVTSHLTYDFWNLTNYTNGASISSGGTYNRSNSGNITYIIASAHWNKVLYNAWIEHNGTGTWQNYTICNYPNCTGNWTNYTLNLSNSTEFNNTVIAVRSIYANDTYSATNSTSALLYFSLSAGNPPTALAPTFSILNSETNKTNKYTAYKINSNVSEDVGIIRVIANITYPDLNSTLVNMTGDPSPGSYIWSYTFGTNLHLNQTGPYNVTVTATDIGNQNSSSVFANFTVYDYYNLTNPSDTLYNRGENVSFEAFDVNGDSVGGPNWDVNVTKSDGNFSNFTVQTTTLNYTILPNDPEGNYTINASAYKDNNTGNISFEFNVSKNLTLTITTNPSSSISPNGLINVSMTLYNARGGIHNMSTNGSIRCTSTSALVDITFSSGQGSVFCNAPNAYSTSFNITLNVTDLYNNTGENYTTLITEAQQVVYTSSGGSGGFATSKKETIKNCTDGTQYSQCSAKRPYYCSNGTLTRKCSICGCANSDYGCQPDGSCALIKEEDFNFSLSAARLEIKQGGDKEITGVLKNTGNTVLELISFYIASEYCCNISMPPSFELKEKEEKVFTILIHAPLFAVIGDYPNTTISIGTNLFRKDKTIDITVGQSQHYNSLSELENQLADIESKIQEVKKAGIDTSNLEAMVEKSKAFLQNANSSIAGDQIDVLSASLANLTNNNRLVESRLGGLRNQAFLLQNAWLIGLFVVMSLTTMYMVPQVLLPLNKKEKQLSELKEEEETLVLSRVETEKQYFMRKIDENTFSKIMIGKQDRILKLRTQIREKENERTQLIKAVSPLAMATWLANGIKDMPQKIKNSPKSILNRKNKNNIDNNGKTQ